MLDRALKLIVTLTLALFLVQAVIGLLIRILETTLTQVAEAFGRAGGAVGGVLFAIAAGALLVGFLVRGAHFIASRDPRAARERASRDRAVRQRVRRPAEDVPPMNARREVQADTDPAVGESEQAH
jgi:hypothetical protein